MTDRSIYTITGHTNPTDILTLADGQAVFATAVTPEQYGALADGMTDDSAAIQSAINAVVATGGGTVLFRAKTYLSSTALSWSGAPVELRGSGSSVQPGIGTSLKFATGLSGAVNPQNGTLGLGGGSIVRNLRILGQGIAAVSDANAALGVGCGLLMQANGCHVEDVVVQGFEGNGVTIYSDGTVSKNANNGTFLNVRVWSNLKNGFATNGPDSNANTIISLDATSNSQAGVLENSSVGNNVYIRPHFAGNGSGTSAVPILIGVSSGANRFLDCYKEIHATSTLLFRTTALSGGKNKITFAQAAGSTGSPTTFTIDDQVGDTEWAVQGVTRQIHMGGDGANGTVNVLTSGDLQVRNSANIILDDTAVTSHWNIQNSGGTLLFFTNQNVAANFYSNAAVTFSYDSAALNLASGKVLKVAGTQVVGARQTGTAANATDLATAITLVNDLKAKLTTHGLIS